MLNVNQLVGFGAGGREPVTSLSFLASDTGTSKAPAAVPATVQAGDLIIIHEAGLSFSSPAAAPSGYILITSASSSPRKNVLSYKIADGTEGGTEPTAFPYPDLCETIILVFRPNLPITNASVQDSHQQFTTGNPTSQTVTSGSGVAPLVVLGAYDADAAISPRTFSPAKDGEVTINTDTYTAYKIYNSSPANVSIDMDDEGVANSLLSCYIQVS